MANVARKLLLVAALGGTIYASFVSSDDVGVTARARPATPGATPKQALVTASAAASAFVEDAADIDDELSDPFAARNWSPPAPPAVEPAKAVDKQAVAAAPPVPEGPPPLPFQFMGSMNDGDDQVVYLSRGDRALIARNGDVLENTYKVIGIKPTQIEFEHIPTGQKQALPMLAHEN